MASRGSTAAAWLGAAAAIAVAAWAIGSPRAKYQLASIGTRLAERINQGIKDLQERMQPRFGRRMAVLQEISQTIDSATTQWESSMTVSKVASALEQEPRLRACNVGVRIIGGILHLEGEVNTPEEKQLATEISKRASGAELVANDLRVTSPTR